MSRVPTLDDADKLANLQDADEKITHKDMRAREIESSNKYFYLLHRRSELSQLRERQQAARIWPINYFNLCFRVL